MSAASPSVVVDDDIIDFTRPPAGVVKLPDPKTGKKDDKRPAVAVVTCMEDVHPQHVRSLWAGRIPIGMVTGIEGDPGLGKSLITLDITARVTTGQPMPDGTPNDDKRTGVVLVTCEDALAHTIKPRLVAAGADCAHVVHLDGIEDGNTVRLPTVEDVDAIRQAIVKVAASLVIIEPIMAFLGKADAHRDQDVRRALAPLVQLVEEMDVALIFGRHLKKSSSETSSLYRGGGSIAFTAAARSLFLVASDPGDESKSRRFFAHSKHNVFIGAPTIAYRVVTTEVPGVGPTPRIEWEAADDSQPCPSADAILQAAARKAGDGADESSKLDAAKTFLQEELGGGAVNTSTILRDGRELGHAEKTLRRAKDDLALVVEKGGKGGWTWRLPSSSPALPDMGVDVPDP